MRKDFIDGAEKMLDSLVDTPLRSVTPVLGGVCDILASDTDLEFDNATQALGRVVLGIVMDGDAAPRTNAERKARQAAENNEAAVRRAAEWMRRAAQRRPSPERGRPQDDREENLLAAERGGVELDRARLLMARSTVPNEQ